MAFPILAFQGERGSFSEEAAYKLLGPRIRVQPCETFNAMFESVSSGKTKYCLAPIENTLAGSVYENYDLLLQYNLHIIREVNLRIVHNLIALPGTRLKDIRQVYSHPVALAQCNRFFEQHPKIEKVPFYDTAGSIKMLVERELRNAAGIASSIAASFYHARILRTHLEDHRENYTRFLLLARKATVSPKANKVSIVFSTHNVPGALFKCLSVFALRDIDLTKLESRPLRGRPFEYFFYADFMGNIHEERTRNALAHLGEVTNFLRILGCYESAKR
ncbi:MAG TPA: prephenate dehydratase [Terriglobia bacterium]|jgi:prephenate dehydratase|nr:prephenate dehydratase [Terriglobia bacterium]